MEHSPVEVALLVAEGLAGGARRQGEHEWFGTPFHRMAIAGPKPEGLSANPRDRRPVNTGRGRRLLAGSFQLAGADMTVGPQGDPFDRPNPNRRFADALHRFGWMGDLLTEGEAGARQGLKLFLDWQRAFGKWNGFSWSARVLERRVFNLACAARRLAAAASEAETAQIAQSLARQARHLISIADQPGRAVERAVVAGIAGCALAGQAGEKLIDAALGRLKHDLAQAVGPDGVHASRCPETGLELLFDLLTLDEALDQRGRAGPEELTRTIDRLATATRFFTLADGRLAAAQGGEAASAERIKAALAHDEDGAAPSLRAAYGGYQRIESAQIQVIADAAAPARGRWGETACGQTLAIEVLCGRDRLITNCAWSPEAAGPQALRLTDAASTASLADHSAGEPLRGLAGFGLGPRLAWGARKVEVRRHDTDAGVWLEMTHDGWAKRYGLIHERKLFLDLANGELRGEDGFIPVPNAKPADGPRKHLPFAVRFHLHPDARASLARDGKSILLRGASDEGWWLRDDAIEASIEASAHFEAGAARRASQIVLRGQVRVDKGGKLRWKLSRAEGVNRPARVLVTGNAGAGKTTLAREIGARLDLPVHGLDAIVWRPGWKKTPTAERNLLLQALADEPAWVIDGVSPRVETRADLVILLDAPPALCTWRCAVRNTPYLLRSRPGLPADCPELLIIPELLRIIWRFDRHVRPGILERCAGRLRIVRGGAERSELVSSLR